MPDGLFGTWFRSRDQAHPSSKPRLQNFTLLTSLIIVVEGFHERLIMEFARCKECRRTWKNGLSERFPLAPSPIDENHFVS